MALTKTTLLEENELFTRFTGKDYLHHLQCFMCYFAISILSDATDVIKTSLAILGMCNYRRFNRRIATKQQ